MSGNVSAMVTSSAYDENMFAFVGQSAEKKLYRVGDKTAPWGTPLLIIRIFEVLD